MTMVSSRDASFVDMNKDCKEELVQPAATVLCQSTAVCGTLSFIWIVERPKTMFKKLEQRCWIKIEVARCRSTHECFQGLREACGDAALS